MSDREELERLRRLAELEARARQGAEPQDGRGVLGFIDDTVRQLAQGATFGYADEIAAGANSLFSDRPYSELVAEERARDDAFLEDNPAIGTGAQVAGGIGSTVALAPVAAGTKVAQVAAKVPSVLRNAGIGASAGGVAGAGFSDEDRLGGAIEGAALGGTLGAALPVVIGIVGKFGKPAVQPLLDRIGKGPEKASVRKILQALERDDLTPEAAMARLRALGDDATISDIGPNTLRLGDAVAARPGPGVKNALDVFTERRGGQVPRILQKFDDAIGPVGDDVIERVEESPAFRASLKRMVPVRGGLIRILERPSMRDAWKGAQRLAREEGVVLPEFDAFLAQAKKGEIVEAETTLMHWLKKGLDDVLEPKRDPVTGHVVADKGRNLLESMKRTRRDFRDYVKSYNDDYKASLRRIELEKRVDEAYEKGFAFSKLKTPEEVKKVTARMDDREKRAFQRGIRDMVENRISDRGEMGFDMTGFVLGNGRKLRAAFGKAADDLIEGVKNERTLAQNENTILGNSATARRIMANEDLGMDPGAFVQGARDVARGDFVGAAANAARGVSNRMRAGGDKVVNELGEMMFTNDPQSLANTMMQLQQGATLNALGQSQREALVRALAAGTGQQSGRFQAQ